MNTTNKTGMIFVFIPHRFTFDLTCLFFEK